MVASPATSKFDASRAWLKQPDMFWRFRVGDRAERIEKAGLDHNERLLVFERNGERRALLIRQMVYHHVAEGELAGEPFVVTF